MGLPTKSGDGPARRVDVEAHAPAQEEIGIEITQHEVRVRHRGLASAERVAGGAGIGPRAVGPHLQEVHAIEACHGSAARPDLDQLDDRDADGQP
jgi:hypothetical protein